MLRWCLLAPVVSLDLQVFVTTVKPLKHTAMSPLNVDAKASAVPAATGLSGLATLVSALFPKVGMQVPVNAEFFYRI